MKLTDENIEKCEKCGTEGEYPIPIMPVDMDGNVYKLCLQCSSELDEIIEQWIKTK